MRPTRRKITLVLSLLCNSLIFAQGILLTEGTVLFHEDFGGNSPSDPRVSSTPLSSMNNTYTHLTTDDWLSMYKGAYLITKSGYCNGDTSITNNWRGSQWHIQDDHTCPNDYNRGYFLEVDGMGGSVPFYSTTITGLPSNIALSFYAYVANVMTWYHTNVYLGGGAVKPDFKFVISTTDDQILSSYSTGPIDSDTVSKTLAPYPNPKGWNVSAKWNPVGFTFRLPDGVNDVKLIIYNNVQDNGRGNDFALDDIFVVDATAAYEEVMTLDGKTIVGRDSVCIAGMYFYRDTVFSNPNIKIKVKH